MKALTAVEWEGPYWDRMGKPALHLDGYVASGAWQAASCVPFFLSLCGCKSLVGLSDVEEV